MDLRQNSQQKDANLPADASDGSRKHDVKQMTEDTCTNIDADQAEKVRKAKLVGYLHFASLCCAALAIFGLAIFVIGYKDLSIGRVSTVSLLLLATLICQHKVRKLKASGSAN